MVNLSFAGSLRTSLSRFSKAGPTMGRACESSVVVLAGT